MRGARLGRGRPNRPIILRNAPAEAPPPVVGSVPVIVVSPWRRRPASRCLGSRIVLRAPLEPATPPQPPPEEPVTYRFTGPFKRWQVSMALERIDSLSREEIPFYVFADRDGQIYDPTAATAEAAFLPDSRTKPDAGDWKDCSWDTSLIGTFRAMCLVGPGGTAELTAGMTYFTWLRITNAATSEIVVRQTGRLIVE